MVRVLIISAWYCANHATFDSILPNRCKLLNETSTQLSVSCESQICKLISLHGLIYFLVLFLNQSVQRATKFRLIYACLFREDSFVKNIWEEIKIRDYVEIWNFENRIWNFAKLLNTLIFFPSNNYFIIKILGEISIRENFITTSTSFRFPKNEIYLSFSYFFRYYCNVKSKNLFPKYKLNRIVIKLNKNTCI